ncbi:MAG: BrnT family toxin [Nitrosomonadales bacterium]|nr:BrnT family toxin [Nitrosomonadales bacterium]
MFRFEWDYRKAKSNALKHGISFDEAVSVFADPLALTFTDTDHSETEDRSRTYGISNRGRLLVVVHTERRNNVRIISARKATRYEKNIYKQG